MKLIEKETGLETEATPAGAEVLLNRGTHVLPADGKPKAKPVPKTTVKKSSAAKYEGDKVEG